MNTVLLILLSISCLSGAWLWLSWRSDGLKLKESRVVMHAASAALVLAVLLLGISHETRGDELRLGLIMLSIATGVLMFLQRQRLLQLNRTLASAHILAGLAALSFIAFTVLAA